VARQQFVPTPDEEALYRALGLAWIPRLREAEKSTPPPPAIPTLLGR
jgi:hypothetical protein